ncbi:recombinase family protein [Streptomyces sp. NPDC000987]|uniref:recombinase family protein n=1 Tax=Streptomyces sp. NPDC000987 TaxID=3154374 RepID=UPI00333242ED
MRQKAKLEARITGNDYVAYLRVSSKGQVNTDYNPEGVSIPAQRVKVEERGRELNSSKDAEFIDPGRTARTIDQRKEFQEMIAYLREHPNVRYVIVYMLSRFARNRLDDAIMVAALERLGVKLISAVEKNIDDTPTGRMLHGMLAVINEYASSQSAEDVKYKMGQKAKNGGTITRAPVGYLNVEERLDDRRFRSVAVDPVRGPLIRTAFELYATGEYTLADLADELYERGLRMPRNARRPERGISPNRLAVVIRDDYYCGWITYEGERYKGRHERLVPEDLFERVQDIANSRTQAQELRRVHHHELKGSLFCGFCIRQHGERRRMILQNATNRHGNTYRYFFCTGRYSHTCELPYVPVGKVEEAVEDHYAHLRFTSEFTSAMRADLADMLDEQQTTTKLLNVQLTKQLRELDTKETNLIDLAADGTLPQEKIRARLRDITRQRDRLTARLQDTDQDLSVTVEITEACLQLLEDPQALYRRCDDQQRRRLNQALFEALYIDEDANGGARVTHQLREPFDTLHTAQNRRQAPGGRAEAPASPTAAVPAPKQQSAPPQPGTGAAVEPPGAALVGGPWKVPGSNELLMVGDTGFEPVTSSV